MNRLDLCYHNTDLLFPRWQKHNTLIKGLIIGLAVCVKANGDTKLLVKLWETLARFPFQPYCSMTSSYFSAKHVQLCTS